MINHSQKTNVTNSFDVKITYIDLYAEALYEIFFNRNKM